jgi:hypothetical protein
VLVKLKITDTALIPVDFFTPSDYKTLNDGADLDYGSLASFLVPGANLYFTGAKDGNIYILNTDSRVVFMLPATRSHKHWNWNRRIYALSSSILPEQQS